MKTYLQQHNYESKARTLSLLLFIITFFAFSYFLTPIPADNVNTRLDLTASMITEHSLNIDKWHLNTIDKAYVDGHYYTDKAPGLSLAALPVAWAYSSFGQVDPDNILFRHICTMFLVSLPAAVLASIFFLIVFSVCKSLSVSFACTLALAFATLWYPYSTLFYGHVPAAVISFILFYILCREHPPSASVMLISGFTAAYMVVIDYPTAAHAVVLLLLASSIIEKRSSLLLLVPGVLVAASVFFMYNHAAFGGWLTIGYLHESYTPFAEAHARGLGGITYPHLSALYDILLKPGRGLFFLSPFLLFSVPGFFAGLRDAHWRKPVIAAGAIVIIHILINASLPIPGGGMSAGPRHLVGMLPFMVFLCVFSLRNAGRFTGGLFMGAFAASSALFLLITATNPHVPQIIDAPVTEYCLKLFANGVLRAAWLPAIINTIPAAYSLYIYLFTVFSLFLVCAYYLREENNRISFAFAVGTVTAMAGILLMNYFAALAFASKSPAHKHYSLGITYMNLDRPLLALNEYSEALTIDPSHAPANFNLGKMANMAGRKDIAIEYFRKAVESDPTIAEAHYNLAVLLYNKAEYEEAFTHFAVFTQIEKMGKTTLVARAFAFMAMIELRYGNTEDAATYIGRAAAFDPGDDIVEQARKKISGAN